MTSVDLALLDWRRRVAEIYRQVRAESDSERAHRRWREQRDELFATHAESPLPAAERATFAGLEYAPYDASLRFEAPRLLERPSTTIAVETGTDGAVRFRCLGAVDLGDLGTLDLWWLEGYGGGLFLPQADRSTENYPGGRYILDTVKGADLGGSALAGALVVDLNFAYNPSCAYDPFWSCPLAPSGNRLSVAVAAGERNWRPPER